MMKSTTLVPSLLAISLWGVTSLSIAQEASSKPAPAVATDKSSPAAAPEAGPTTVLCTDTAQLKANQGKQVTVTGEVIRTKDWDGGPSKKKKMNFIDLKGGYVTAVTFEEDFAAFGSNLPAKAYTKGKTVAITGELQERQGRWQIILKSPDQIKENASPAATEAKTGKNSEKEKSAEKSPTETKASTEPEAATDAAPTEKKRVDPSKYFNKKPAAER